MRHLSHELGAYEPPEPNRIRTLKICAFVFGLFVFWCGTVGLPPGWWVKAPNLSNTLERLAGIPKTGHWWNTLCSV